MVLGLGIIDSLMLTSHGIIASMLAMVLGRLARWDRNRQADLAASRPTPQERLLADFCENAAIGMCSVAPNGRILWANKAELNMLGFAPQDYIGHHITEFHADAASMSEVLARLRAGELLHEYETRLRCRDGSIKHVLMDSNIHRRDGELVSTRFFTRDITERRQFEAQQRELYSRYESLITRSPAGIFETDAKGRCVFVNEKWSELSGLTRQQALGAGWKQAIHPEDRERELEAWQKNTSAGEELQINCRWMTPKGTVTWVHGSVVPLRSSKGEITGFLGTISDISALKQAEAVIREARNQAEAANRTKSEFLANMSHEMRTPLNGIIGMTDLALDAAVDAEQRDCLQTVKESADSLLTIINELLDFAKVEAGKITLDRVDFHLGDWLRDSLKPLMFRSRQKGLDFRCLIDANIPKQLVGDPEWLRHILVNLVSNAVKFTDKGFVRCSVKLKSIATVDVPIWELDSVAGTPTGAVPPRTSAQRATLHFAVQDTGIGVPTDKHQAIFVPFEQADKSITRRYGGTGLGLAIARQLTELMQGSIWVESVLGEGSTFHFTVQLGISDQTSKRVAPPEAEKPQVQPKTPAAKLPPTRKLRILVAEDNPVNQQLIVKFLKKQGHETAVANDGSEAVEALDRDPNFDIVLMDMQMPRMSGLEATAVIRKQEESTGRHIPIIALTASVLKGDRERCLASGMDEYLTKPVNRNELFAALGRVSTVDPAVVDTSDSATIDLDERVPVPAPIAPQDKSLPARDLHCEETLIMPKTNSSLLSALTWETTAPSVIDRKTLWKRLDGDRELLRELLEGYRGCCPEVVAELREGVTRQDSKLVQRAAHQLKGMVSSLAATNAFSTARDLERSGQASDFTQAPDILAKLEVALREVDAELECIVNQS